MTEYQDLLSAIGRIFKFTELYNTMYILKGHNRFNLSIKDIYLQDHGITILPLNEDSNLHIKAKKAGPKVSII